MSASNEKEIDLESCEHAFARDFVFCVTKAWRPEWEPEGVFTLNSDNSPFTSSMKTKIHNELFEDRHKFQETFESEFPGAEITDNTFKIVADDLMNDYIKPTKWYFFNPERFYKFCLKISKFAAHAICFKIEFAPYIAVDNIYEAIRAIKLVKSFDEDSFTKLDKYCAGQPYD